MRYLNWKGPQGRETVDELDPEDFNTLAEYKQEARRLASEYTLAGMAGVYWSGRPCKNWIR